MDYKIIVLWSLSVDIERKCDINNLKQKSTCNLYTGCFVVALQFSRILIQCIRSSQNNYIILFISLKDFILRTVWPTTFKFCIMLYNTTRYFQTNYFVHGYFQKGHNTCIQITLKRLNFLFWKLFCYFTYVLITFIIKISAVGSSILINKNKLIIRFNTV